jgi:hypothetical protein
MIDPDGNYVLLNDIEGRLGEGILWYHHFFGLEHQVPSIANRKPSTIDFWFGTWNTKYRYNSDPWCSKQDRLSILGGDLHLLSALLCTESCICKAQVSTMMTTT